PAVHFPEPGGLSMSDVRRVIEEVMATGKVCGLNIACYHNDEDADGSAAARLVRMLSEVLT
ncbi:MAG: arginase family protein, partial [bacterium]|nr:arginase family protein [bacterium]